MAEPIKTIRMGQIKASIWKNEKQDKEGNSFNVFSASIEKSYVDKDGNWKSTTSFSENEIPKLEAISRKCYEEIQELKNKKE